MRNEAASPASCPLAFTAVSFAAGILVARHIEYAAILTIPSAFAAALVAFAAGTEKLKTLLLLISFSFAGVYAAIEAQKPADPARVRSLIDAGRIVEDAPVGIEGVVAWGPEPMPGGAYMDVECEGITGREFVADALGRVRIYVSVRDAESRRDFEALAIRPGSRVRIDAALTRQDPFRNPGGFSYGDYLDRRGLDASGSVKSPLLIQSLGEEGGWFLRAAAMDVRLSLLNTVLERLPPMTAGLLTASMLGNRHFLDKKSAEAFREGGTYHLLVISGLHVTFMGAAVLLVLSPFRLPDPAKYTAATLFVWIFAAVSGLGVPVTRAALMFSFIALAKGLFLESNGLNSLGACALVILVLDPAALFDPSFQLTVTSAGAIVGVAFPLISKMRAIGAWFPAPAHPLPPFAPDAVRKFCELLYWSSSGWEARMSGSVWQCRLYKSQLAKRFGGGLLQRSAQWLCEGLIVSTVAQLFLLPLSVVHFHRIVLLAPLLNLPAGVLLVAHNALGLAAAAAYPVSQAVSGAFSSIADLSVRTSVSIQTSLSAPLGGSFRIPAYSGEMSAIYPLYLLSLAVAAIALSKVARLRKTVLCLAFVPAVLGFLIIAHPYSSPAPEGSLRLSFLDVGQGDSIFVTFPDGTTMLVDGGGRPEFFDTEGGSPGFRPDRRSIGESVVSEFLWELGYSRVDRIIATHSDADHLDGLIDVAKNFEVGAAWYGAGYGNGGEFSEFREALASRSVPLRALRAGDSFTAGGANVEVLNPGEREASDNDGSVVLLISFGNRRFLLTGDIEAQAENALFEAGLLEKADAVKVPHHGSRTSSTERFVETTRPDYAVISVGRRSPFGHPHQEVVDRWIAAGSKVLTTGECGTVTMVTNGSTLEIDTFAETLDRCRKDKTPAGF